MTALYEMTGEMKELQNLLNDLEDTAEHEKEGSMGLAIRDTLESIELEFNDKAVAIVKLSQALDGDTQAIDSEIKRLQGRKKTILNRREELREYLRQNMETTGVKKIECPVFSITLSKGREQVKIEDENQIPDEYMTVKTEIKPDKNAISKALKSGEEIPGASMATGKSSIRVK